MRVITLRSLIREVPSRWAERYRNSGDPDKARIGKELDSLDTETATADDISRIIGNGSWTRQVCSECAEEVDTAIQVGEEPDYESSTAWLCASCIAKAADLMRAAQTVTVKHE